MIERAGWSAVVRFTPRADPLIAPDEAARVVSETFDEAWSTAASFDQLCHKVDNWLITRARDRARERAASLRPRNSGGKRARPGA